MSDHVIIQARDALIAILKEEVDSVAERVYKAGEVPQEELSAERSPFIVVQLGGDQDERISMNNGSAAPDILEDVKATIFVHCVVKMDGDAELAAYNVRSEVETALLSTNNGLTLGGAAVMISRVAADNNRDEALDQGAYNVALQFEVLIQHPEGRPTSLTFT